MYNSKSLFQKRNYQKCWGVEANCATLQQLAFFADFRALYFSYFSFVVLGEIQASLRFLKFEQVCPQKLKSMFWGFFKFSLAYWLKIVFLSHGNDTSNPYLPLHYFPIHSYLCNYLGLFWNVFCSVFVGEKGIKFDEQDRPTSAFFGSGSRPSTAILKSEFNKQNKDGKENENENDPLKPPKTPYHFKGKYFPLVMNRFHFCESRPWSSMPVTENSSLLFSFIHLQLVIFR